MAFQHKLKHFREMHKLSMEDLANALKENYNLDINKNKISRWENGSDPKVKDVQYVAYFFNVSPIELIDLELEIKENSDVDLNLGLKIKKLRKDQQLTQAELAKLLGVAPTTVSAWERDANKPLMDKLSSMCKLFNVPVSYFFEGEGSSCRSEKE